MPIVISGLVVFVVLLGVIGVLLSGMFSKWLAGVLVAAVAVRGAAAGNEIESTFPSIKASAA